MLEKREICALFVKRAQKGDLGAIDTLIRQHRERLYRFICGLCQDADEASDVLAETFIRAYRSLPTFKGEAEFSTWLFRIATNVFYDARKRDARIAQQISELGAMADTQKDVAQHEIRPDRYSELREKQAMVRRAVNLLSNPHRDMVEMYYFNEASYEEIAEVFEIPLGTVKSRMNRARETLANLLQDEPAFYLA